MVEEIDKGQERGEVATDATGGGRPPKTSPDFGEVFKPATSGALVGLTLRRHYPKVDTGPKQANAFRNRSGSTPNPRMTLPWAGRVTLPLK